MKFWLTELIWLKKLNYEKKFENFVSRQFKINFELLTTNACCLTLGLFCEYKLEEKTFIYANAFVNKQRSFPAESEANVGKL